MYRCVYVYVSASSIYFPLFSSSPFLFLIWRLAKKSFSCFLHRRHCIDIVNGHSPRAVPMKWFLLLLRFWHFRRALQLFWCGRQSRQLLSYGSPFPFPRLNKQETVEWQTKCRNKNTFGIVSDAASDKSGRNSKQQTVTNSTQCRLDLWRDYVYTFTKMDEMECSYLI